MKEIRLHSQKKLIIKKKRAVQDLRGKLFLHRNFFLNGFSQRDLPCFNCHELFKCNLLDAIGGGGGLRGNK